jgi:hypothetical protein
MNMLTELCLRMIFLYKVNTAHDIYFLEHFTRKSSLVMMDSRNLELQESVTKLGIEHCSALVVYFNQ